jgi:hypothetical protein
LRGLTLKNEAVEKKGDDNQGQIEEENVGLEYIFHNPDNPVLGQVGRDKTLRQIAALVICS